MAFSWREQSVDYSPLVGFLVNILLTFLAYEFASYLIDGKPAIVSKETY